MTDKVDAVVAALMEWQYSNVSLEASFRKHGLLPAPAPSLRWPGVEVVKAEDGRWDARTDAHFLYVDDGDGVRMWWKRTHGGDASGMFGHRIDALSALNDPRTPPPPHVAEGKEGDDGMESRCSDFRRTKGEAHSEREIALACSFASSEVTRATAALTAERDRLAAELAKAKVESNTYHAAIMWALGVTGTWPARKPGDGAFYWRKRLQSMAGIGDDELSRSTAAKKPGRKGARR